MKSAILSSMLSRFRNPQSAIRNSLRLALLGLGLGLLLTGCSLLTWPQQGFGRGYEYRYRVFEASEALPSTLNAPFSSDQMAERFLPVGALNHSMDALAKEGFTLQKVERIPGGNYYTFTFRRVTPRGSRPSLAPAEYVGVYQVQAPGDTTQFYALTPNYEGDTVVIFHGAEQPQVFDAKWDGEHLQAQVGDTHHLFMLSGDGLTMVHTQEQILPGGFVRKVFNTRRIQTGKP